MISQKNANPIDTPPPGKYINIRTIIETQQYRAVQNFSFLQRDERSPLCIFVFLSLGWKPFAVSNQSHSLAIPRNVFRLTVDAAMMVNLRGTLLPEKTPQIVLVSFDDDVEKQHMDFYDDLFEGVQNPNNCPVQGTLFVSHNYTNYYLVEDAYSRGYEIADHTVTHQEPTTYWEYAYANNTVWKSVIEGQKEILHR